MRGVRTRHREPVHACGAVPCCTSSLFRARGALGIALLATAASAALAHPISMSTAYVTIRKDGVSAKIEIMPEDFYMFYGLQPNDEGYLSAADVMASVERHKGFLLEYFVIQDVDGRRLSGKIAKVEAFEMGPEGLKMGDLMARDVVYHLEFGLALPPESLTIHQEFGVEGSMVPAVMELHVRVEDGEWRGPDMLGRNVPHTVSFDWGRPRVSPTASVDDMDERKTRERTNTLGITSYGSIYSFVYITEYEVRHEILIPLLTLETWLPVERRDEGSLEVAEQEAARRSIEAFFTEHNPIEIDGIRVKPTLARLDFYGLEFRDFARRSEPRRLSAMTARIGVILSCSTKGAPGHVKVTWDMFNSQVYEVRAAVYAYEKSLKNVFSIYEPVFEWSGFGRPAMPAITEVPLPPVPTLEVPAASLACLVLLAAAIPFGLRRLRRSNREGASARRFVATAVVLGLAAAAALSFARVDVPHPFASGGSVSEDEAADIFASLHRNVYRAFDYRSESDIYDALAKSVGGDLLTELYVQIRQGLEMQEQGGAVSRIREVRIVDGRKEPPKETVSGDARAFAYRCTWTVSGTVEHWGHIHSRTNRHEAVFTVEPLVRPLERPRGSRRVARPSGTRAWKITAARMLRKERIRFETRLRKFS